MLYDFHLCRKKVIKIGRTGRPKKTETDVERDKMIGKRFRLIRKTLGKTQEEVAEYFNKKSVQAVRDWEAGRSSIPVDVLQKLSDNLGIDMDFLLCKYDSPDLQSKIQEWNKKAPRVRAEFQFTESAKEIVSLNQGSDYSERDYEEFMTYIRMYQERKEQMKTRSEIKVITGLKENRIIENFETGEITIQAISEEDVEKGFQQLVKRGIIAE